MLSDTMPWGVEPPSPLNYKRAVVKSAPREFTVEVLEPVKHGNNYSYGVKVCPIIRSQSSSDSRSLSSRSTISYSEYEIWRRWEDCLDFQRNLEDLYAGLSRQKIKVLNRGKRGKKKESDENSFYTLNTAAASFESLPEGPDPREVAVDVHQLIPQLSRKGTLFRINRAVATQRGKEFTAMVNALFDPSPDAPVLLQELRNESAVRDFFAFWRRDKDLVEKAGKSVPRLLHSNRSMSSISTSFSRYSSVPSTPDSFVFPPTPTSVPPMARLRHSVSARLDQTGPKAPDKPPGSAPPGSASHHFIPESPIATPPFFLDDPTSQRSLPRNEGTQRYPRPIVFTDELLLQESRSRPSSYVQSNPDCRSFDVTSGATRLMQPETPARPSYSTSNHLQESIPEEPMQSRPQLRARSNSAATLENRRARIFVPTSSTSVVPFEEQSAWSTSTEALPYSPVSSPQNIARMYKNSLRSPATSNSSHSPSVSSHFSSMSIKSRLSFASSKSSYTQASKRSSGQSHLSHIEPEIEEEGSGPESAPDYHHDMLPRPASQKRGSVASFASFRTEASEDGVLPMHLRPQVDARPTPAMQDEKPIGDTDDLIDTYFSENINDTLRSSMIEPCFRSYSRRHSAGKRSISSISSGGSSLADQTIHDAFAVKALYRDHIIVFRAERSMTLANVRQRIKERFALHECLPLDDSFFLAYAPPRITPSGVGRQGMTRSSSVTSTTSDMSRLRLLQVENDWQAALLTCNPIGKVTIRVLDSESQSRHN